MQGAVHVSQNYLGRSPVSSELQKLRQPFRWLPSVRLRMTLANLQADGSVVPLGQIIGYRVAYYVNGQLRYLRFRDRRGKMRELYSTYQAAKQGMRDAVWNTKCQCLRLGIDSQPRVEPVYSGGKMQT